MISDFIKTNLKKASYKILGDGSYYGEIRGIRGVWANSRNLENCRKELQEVLEDWVIIKLKDGDRIPGLDIHFDKHKHSAHA